MEPLDPQLRRMIDDGLPAAMPDAAAKERGLAALLAQVDGPPPPAPAAAPAGSATAGLTKLVIGVVAAGTVAAAGWAATRPDPAPAVMQSAPPAPAEPAAEVQPRASTPPPAVAPAATPAHQPEPALQEAPPPAKPRTRSAAPEPPASSPADLLRAEADLIARAESALDRGKPREALALCDMHRTKFEAPQLTTERSAIAASAACLVDGSDTAAAVAFLRAHPRSALAKKVRERCGLEPSPRKSTAP